ncbi:relaxase/mobilization nuclease domain-containing protein [Roseateles sp. DC23W]|uniref:Relaxase/mobilization nuclease domain-containing protein n=1 Tax=Pelomonas dachongensis TaxID=3299029 RepID=A0ABW7EX38_9BURK
MISYADVNAALVQWGDRLFYPGNRRVRTDRTPRLDGSLGRQAQAIRSRIEATVVRRAPQAFFKITGGGKGMAAIAKHFAYISRGGQLALEDDRGLTHSSKEEIRELLQQWRYGGAFIPDVSARREAMNFVLATAPGSDPHPLRLAVRDFARATLSEHRYVMVLHEDRAHPHVHLTVRAHSMSGRRLQTWSPQERWRSEFAERLRALGVDVEATGQSTRGESRMSIPIWQVKAEQRGTLRNKGSKTKSGEAYLRNCAEAMTCWSGLMTALQQSPSPEDRKLAEGIHRFVRETPFFQEVVAHRERQVAQAFREQASRQTGTMVVRDGQEWTR